MPATESSFIELQSVDSTNKYAMEQLHAGLAFPGNAIFAHEQTAGRGQRGKHWISEKNSNIALSLILDPQPLSPSEAFKLSALIALSVYDFTRKYTGDDVRIKWPNDIYWRDRKAGGILIENQVKTFPNGDSQWIVAVVGIGLNINQVSFPGLSPRAVSFRQITGREFTPLLLAQELAGSVFSQLSSLLNTPINRLLERYNSALYKKGEAVKLKQGSRVFETVILEVNSQGQLITGSSAEQVFDHGQVEWLH